jgi:2-haloacid dehalogenase
MTPSRPRAVVWDLGGVLISWDPRAVFRGMLGSDAEVEEFLAEVDFAAWNHRQDAGRPMAEGVADLVARFPHRRELAEAYPARFAETLVGPVPGSVELLAELRERGDVRLLALTNWSAEMFPHALAGYPFLSWFEALVVSGREGVAKPDPRIFRLLLERHGLAAAETVYVDDAPPNVAAADALGLTALRFVDAPTLRADLARLGLLGQAGGGSAAETRAAYDDASSSDA